MPRRLLAALLVIVFSTALWASPESRWFIENADEATLVEMAALRGMDTDVDASELRQALLEREDDFSTAVGSLPVEEGGYQLTVLSADGMDLNPEGLVTLSGSVAVEFTLEGDEAGKTLSADHMVLDPTSGRVTAYGNVSYRDSAADSGLEQIEADIVSYLYDTGELLVSGGTTTSERTNNEDEEVTFYTTGRLLSYNTGQEGLFFQDGYLTSNPDTAYSSITAKYWRLSVKSIFVRFSESMPVSSVYSGRESPSRTSAMHTRYPRETPREAPMRFRKKSPAPQRIRSANRSRQKKCVKK